MRNVNWTTPRIWRSAESRFNADEPLDATQVYTPSVLADIARQGFDAVWMRGRLRQLTRSEVFPELNDEQAPQRIANIRQLIADGRENGIRLFLYFHEPLALARDHHFWKNHPELAGEPLIEPDFDWDLLALCTSTPQVRDFLNESVRNLFDDVTELGGVIITTASEYHTHCWSHRARKSTGDEYMERCRVQIECPNCRDREPADVVAELVRIWQQQAERTDPAPEVWAWNWSWSMWYDEPQTEVIEKLPPGVKLMCDFERGGARRQDIGMVAMDEYSLGYVGPSDRFTGSRAAAAERGVPVCAKLQIGTTHELATVPNLPLIPCLYAKLHEIDALGLSGLMCSWNFGNTPSLNTAAFGMFARRPDLRHDREAFFDTLAREYLGAADPDAVAQAWMLFCDAFAQYPFSIKMLYFSPMNYAVAYPLKLDYEDRPMGPSWIFHEPWGDRLEDCSDPFTAEQVCRCFDKMEQLWRLGLELYTRALDDAGNKHQVEELSCARMIGCHLSAMRNICDFHAARRGKMRDLALSGPCRLPGDEDLLALIRKQRETCKAALELARNDPRLGYHQEPHARFYGEETIRTAIECDGVRPSNSK